MAKIDTKKYKKAIASISNFISVNKSPQILGYKNLSGFIAMIKKQNKICTKHNMKVKLEIILPIKE